MAIMDDFTQRAKTAAQTVGDRTTAAWRGLRGGSAAVAPEVTAAAPPLAAAAPEAAVAAPGLATRVGTMAGRVASKVAPLARAGVVTAPLAGFGDYKFNSGVDSSVGGTASDLAHGEFARAGQGLVQGAKEAALDSASGIAKFADTAAGLVGADPGLARGLARGVQSHYGSDVKINPTLLQQPAPASAPLGTAPVPNLHGPTGSVVQQPGLAAPAAAPVMAPPQAAQTSHIETFSPGSAGARGIRGQINNGYVPDAGGGLITNNSTGSATRINPPQPAAAAPAEAGGLDSVRAMLVKQATQDFGDPLVGRRGRAQAAELLLNDDAKRAELGLRTAQMSRQTMQQNIELDDKRMKDFREQHINNQFTDPVTGKPNQARNDQFLNFMRENAPRFGVDLASLTKLDSQNREKLVGEMRAEFLKNENVNKSVNSQWFGNPGLSNKAAQINTVRKSRWGDIGADGVGFRPLYDWLPRADDRVVDTSQGLVPAVDYIGDVTSEGSYDRREELARRGLRSR